VEKHCSLNKLLQQPYFLALFIRVILKNPTTRYNPEVPTLHKINATLMLYVDLNKSPEASGTSNNCCVAFSYILVHNARQQSG
jgi:hypothetical protein